MVAQADTNYLVAVVLVLMNSLWLASLIFGVPGTWLILLSTAVAAWLQWAPGVDAADQAIGIYVLLTLLGLAVLGEVLEFIAGAAGARKAGGSPRGAVGAVVGGVIGAIVGTFLIPVPVLGSLLGASAGAGLAAWAVELYSGKTLESSVRIGVGAGVGRLMGTLYKLVVGFVMWCLAAVAAFWP